MTTLHGKNGDYLLFTDEDGNAAIVDAVTNMVVEIGTAPLLAGASQWNEADETEVPQAIKDLARGALADLRVQIVAAGERMYTIPKAAQEEAKRALEWRKKHDRGGTPVGLNTARTLANGGQIGIQKVRHIAKYFPRHEVDKKAQGYKPGEKGFPSNGRIAWALWGGDAAWRWARAIVERENKKAMRAGGYDDYETYRMATDYRSDLDAFKEAYELGEGFGPEFVARVRLDGSGIDRLYKIDVDGTVAVWDDGYWDDLGSVEGDILTYDKSLDTPYDTVEKQHIIIDTDSALIVSAYLQQSPFTAVSVTDLNAEESELVLLAAEEIDWELVDRAIVAAPAPQGGVDSTDGVYTPEERSQKARKQVRDKTGKFASSGSRVVVGGDAVNGRGYITGINSDTQSVTVKLDSGESITVPANQTEKEGSSSARVVTNEGGEPATPLDTSGIFAQPRAPIDRPNAYIPGGLPALTPDDLRAVVSNFPVWVKDQRERLQSEYQGVPAPKVRPSYEKSDYLKGVEKSTGRQLITDARQHPLLADFFKRKDSKLWYSPIISAAETEDPAAETQKPGEPLTPETSDVEPMYVAIVSPDDPRAVLDLVAVVPASTTSTSPATFSRIAGKWESDPQILADLNSPTPPPVVPLDSELYKDVLAQVDGATEIAASALVAKGGLDRNRGNAEKLRRYWLYGKGALKIRWNTPGDWTRCVRQLSKYMGPRAKGYCALRHKEATGLWTGDKAHRKMYGNKRNAFSTEEIVSSEQFIEAAALVARAADARERVLVAGGSYGKQGCKFKIPLVIPEEVESGDGRVFKKGAISLRELPLPLMWQIKTADGHSGSVVVGRIDSMEQTDKGIGNAYGVFDSGPYGREAERLVREGFIRGVSADLDMFEASEEKVKDAGDSTKEKIGGGKIEITKARVMAVTIVPKPAFQECRIFIEESSDASQNQEAEMIPDGVYAEEVNELDAQALVACGMIASSIPVVPPADWFANPGLKEATPLTVTDDGRVFGHIAAWHVDHIGMSFGTKPPRSKSRYAYFHTGVVRADDGKDYPVGQLTLAGGHASLEASAVDAVKHYDDTASAIADVHAGEDAHGIWVAGSLRPSATPEQIRALRASAPSGDWRPIKGSLELVAVCQVNVPGFPIARARVAGGQVYALVAAGAQVLAKMKSDPLAELNARVARIEDQEKRDLLAKAAAASAIINEVRDKRNAELAAKAEELSSKVRSSFEYDTLGYISRQTREKLANEGKALPDGSYPIRNVEELKNAIQAYGRSKPSKRAAVRRHIMKSARRLKSTDLVPEKWKSASLIDEEVIDEIQARVASLKASAESEFADISQDMREKLAKQGKALPDGSYPIRNVSDLKNAIQAYGRSNPEDRAKVRTHIRKRARALGQKDLIPENWKAASTEETAVEGDDN